MANQLTTWYVHPSSVPEASHCSPITGSDRCGRGGKTHLSPITVCHVTNLSDDREPTIFTLRQQG